MNGSTPATYVFSCSGAGAALLLHWRLAVLSEYKCISSETVLTELGGGAGAFHWRNKRSSGDQERPSWCTHQTKTSTSDATVLLGQSWHCTNRVGFMHGESALWSCAGISKNHAKNPSLEGVVAGPVGFAGPFPMTRSLLVHHSPCTSCWLLACMALINTL